MTIAHTASVSAVPPRPRSVVDGRASTFVSAVILVILVLQRLALPGADGQVPVIVPAVVLLALVGAARGVVGIRPRGAAQYALIGGSAAFITFANALIGRSPSLSSLLLVLVLYVALVVRLRAPLGMRPVRRFIDFMVICSVLSVGQFVIQFVVPGRWDLLGQLLPEEILMRGFHTNDPIAYGSPLFRTNAFVFLEPSFLSLCLGLAVVLSLTTRGGYVRTLLLLLGMAPTLAGNGLVVLGTAVVWFVVTGRAHRLMPLIPGLAIGIGSILITPLGQLYLRRGSEAGSSDSSSSYRFIQPYSVLLPAWPATALDALIGHGAGSSGDFLSRSGDGLVTTPIIPKIAFEYGALGLAGMLLPLAVLVAREAAKRPWLLGFVLTFFFVNASFLLAILVYLLILFLVILPPETQIRDGGTASPRSRRSGRHTFLYDPRADRAGTQMKGGHR